MPNHGPQYRSSHSITPARYALSLAVVTRPSDICFVSYPKPGSSWDSCNLVFPTGCSGGTASSATLCNSLHWVREQLNVPRRRRASFKSRLPYAMGLSGDLARKPPFPLQGIPHNPKGVDLGTNPTNVERNLEIHTTRAHKWDCLLDEADFFVSQRDWRDTERNALVSVFLRQLEYYSGILFLTTNRIGVINEAFKSRIHASLRYPSIGLAETLKIWDNILDRIERDNKRGTELPVRFDRDALLKYAENHSRRNEPDRTWNGRQIRNAFQLAIALGRHERERLLSVAGGDEANAKKALSVKLTVSNFRSIAETAREFEEYLFDLRGHTDSHIAFEESLRYDAHGYAVQTTKDYGVLRGSRRGGGGFQRGSSADLLSPTHNGSRGARPRGSATGSPSEPRKLGPQVAASVEEEEDIFEEDLSD